MGRLLTCSVGATVACGPSTDLAEFGLICCGREYFPRWSLEKLSILDDGLSWTLDRSRFCGDEQLRNLSWVMVTTFAVEIRVNHQSLRQFEYVSTEFQPVPLLGKQSEWGDMPMLHWENRRNSRKPGLGHPNMTSSCQKHLASRRQKLSFTMARSQG